LLHVFQHKSLQYDAQTAEYYHPGQSARVLMDGALVAQFGQIHPEIRTARKLASKRVYCGTLSRPALSPGPARKSAISFCALIREWSVIFLFVFDDGATSRRFRQTVIGLGLTQLRSFVPQRFSRGGKVCLRASTRCCCGPDPILRAYAAGRRSDPVVGKRLSRHWKI